MEMKKKLIEVALPLEAINAESAREKSIRFGHPSTLHLWWARRPLATARAVIWASLVDDPSSHPELYPDAESQQRAREALFGILSKLVKWENSNDMSVLNAAKDEIRKTIGENLPILLDPFAGGGAIPFEAQRLGLEAHAHDLNPVAVMINKAMIEIPPKFAGQKPVNRSWRSQVGGEADVKGSAGLAEDVRYYGEWMKQEAFKRIGWLYPKVRDERGIDRTVIAWIWARTTTCPNPACGCIMPLVSSFVLSKKKGDEAWIEHSYQDGQNRFRVRHGAFPKSADSGTKFVNEKGMGKKGTFCCPVCHTIVDASTYVDNEANNGRIGAVPIAIVAEGANGRIYLSPDAMNMDSLIEDVENYYKENSIDEKVPHAKCRGTFASNAQGGYYGFHEFKDYFTHRQLIALTTFSELVEEAQNKAEGDAVSAGMVDDRIGLDNGGLGAKAYGEAIGVYLAFGVDRMADIDNALCPWEPVKTQVRHLFGRQAIPMLWDYGENNVFNNAAGDYMTSLGSIIRVISTFSADNPGYASQANVKDDCRFRSIMISTDPPYYDNVGYADLSDFFYVWMRQTIKQTYPNLFKTMLVPKAEELIATPYRHDGDMKKAKAFFEEGMYAACCMLYSYASDDIPVTIYYAFKQSDTDENNATASSGWETMLSAIIRSGFMITGTWPMRTELTTGLKGRVNALASSIVLVCRKRSADARSVTRREFINALHREMRPALEKLQSANIAPVDLAQSAIGPGIGVFSRFKSVLEADGKPMSVRSALQIINQELDAFYNEQEGELDRESRFCVDLFNQYAFNTLKFGDADILARAKNTSVQALVDRGVMYAAKGQVRLLTREELPENVKSGEECIWLLTQQLARAMEKDGVKGCASIIMDMYGSNSENAKALAYRLYTICERKNWAQEGFAYNNLVVAWPEIQAMAADMQAAKPVQLSLADIMIENK